MSRRKQSNPQHVNEPPIAATQSESTTRPELSEQLSKAVVSSPDEPGPHQMDANEQLMTFEGDQKKNSIRARFFEGRWATDAASAEERRRHSGEYSHHMSMYQTPDEGDGHEDRGVPNWTSANRRQANDDFVNKVNENMAVDVASQKKNGDPSMNYGYSCTSDEVRQMSADSNASTDLTENMVQGVENSSVDGGSQSPSGENIARHLGIPPPIVAESGYCNRHRSNDSSTSLKDDVGNQDDHRATEEVVPSPMEMQAPNYKQVAEYEERLRQIAEQNLLEQQRNKQHREAGETEDKNEDIKEIDDIKDQVRRLQQQQMCQIQMLNYLHFQLAMFASSNPQPQRQAPLFFPGAQQAFSGLNGMQIQNMLANAMANGPTALHNGLPSMPNLPAQQYGELLGKKEASELGDDDEVTNERSALFEQKRIPGSLEFEANDKMPDCESGTTTANRLDNDDSTTRHLCRYCQKVFGSESSLQIHMRSHTGERPYKCNICANRFSTKGNLKVHFVRHKAKYPHIEMNPHTVPEYLDNIPTDNGIPIGMSVVPDESDVPGNNDGSDRGSPSEFLEDKQQLEGTQFPASQNHREGEMGPPAAENISTRDQYALSTNGMGVEPSNPPPMFASFAMHPNGINGEHHSEEGRSFSETVSRSPSEVDKNEKPLSKTPNTPMAMTQPQQSRLPSSDTKKLENLVNQIDRGKDLEKNECHICRRVLSCQSALKLHYRTHTGERPFKCDLCSRAFTTRGNLRTHYSSVHRQQLRPSPPQSNNASRTSVLQCPLCGSRFMDQQSLQQHMQMHLYINSQQQHQQQQHHHQQIARLIAGQQPGVVSLPGYPPVSLPSSKLDRKSVSPATNDNQSSVVNESSDQPEDESWRNNDVFEERSPAPSIGARGSPEQNGPLPDSAPNGSHTPPQSASPRNESGKFERGAKQPSALDLTRQNSNTPVEGVRTPDDAQNEMQVVSPMKSVSNPLSELAHLASSSAIMRPGGMAMMSLQASPPSDDARQRKLSTACEICNKPFTCQSALEIHLRSHTKERPYVCRICERGFTTKGNLKQHLLTHNITEVDDDMLEPVSSPAAVSITESPVSSPSMTNGVQSNGMKRPLESTQTQPSAKRTYPRHWCHICQKQFSSASSLQIHNRTHTGEKPFACSVCGRAFTTKGNLKVHMGTHVWGAGGSRRGRRISMDNPLISPWMQNTSNTASNPGIRPRAPQAIPGVPDPAIIYQQYAALASAGLMGVKATADPRFHGSGILNLNNSAAARLLLSPGNGHVTPPATVPLVGQTLSAIEAMKANDNKNVSAAEWFWKAYQRTQEQVN